MSYGSYGQHGSYGAQTPHRLLYAPQCPNCMRFVGALDRTPARDSVAKIDVNSLAPEQRKRVTAVPMLILNTGTVLVGTKAFEWLKQYEGESELDCFYGGRGLAFSEVADDTCTMAWSTPYSAFEPVP